MFVMASFHYNGLSAWEGCKRHRAGFVLEGFYTAYLPTWHRHLLSFRLSFCLLEKSH